MKKTCLILLAAVLLLFAGCITIEDSTKDDTTAAPAETTAAPAEETEEPAETVEVIKEAEVVKYEMKHSYEEMEGLYVFDGEIDDQGNKRYAEIFLYQNGTYYMMNYIWDSTGRSGGNYVIVDDRILINQIYQGGAEPAIDIYASESALSINEDGSLTSEGLYQEGAVFVKNADENLLKPYRDGNKFYEILNTYEIYNQKPSYY